MEKLWLGFLLLLAVIGWITLLLWFKPIQFFRAMRQRSKPPAPKEPAEVIDIETRRRKTG